MLVEDEGVPGGEQWAGSAVTITVSSTSEMMPNVALGSTMNTGDSNTRLESEV
nr:hypothetical protein [Leifsonia poae]